MEWLGCCMFWRSGGGVLLASLFGFFSTASSAGLRAMNTIRMYCTVLAKTPTCGWMRCRTSLKSRSRYFQPAILPTLPR
ncbi:hypothetical protein B0T24DRAFT_622937 [Lasiosphaeria ovina]|uniref:Uncharacterized protein n=1 Tax=Lasiosphaeria ovina TaxID=92902 RepID=A0AAE0KBC1_9PEZI|nr:hypothetical protein B0T24DRAFT_622937 [Lasiosphaeria ovina]